MAPLLLATTVSRGWGGSTVRDGVQEHLECLDSVASCRTARATAMSRRVSSWGRRPAADGSGRKLDGPRIVIQNVIHEESDQHLDT